MKKAELLQQLESTRAEFEVLLAQLTPDDLVQPGVAGPWSIKDMLAHLSWYSGEEAGLIAEDPSYQASPLWETPEQPRNALLWEQFRDRTLDEVLTDFRGAFETIVAAVRRLSDEDLVTGGRFPGTSDEHPPWLDIAHSSFSHEQEHIAMIRNWLALR
jgi:hypothetical protein